VREDSELTAASNSLILEKRGGISLKMEISASLTSIRSGFSAKRPTLFRTSERWRRTPSKKEKDWGVRLLGAVEGMRVVFVRD